MSHMIAEQDLAQFISFWGEGYAQPIRGLEVVYRVETLEGHGPEFTAGREFVHEAGVLSEEVAMLVMDGFAAKTPPVTRGYFPEMGQSDAVLMASRDVCGVDSLWTLGLWFNPLVLALLAAEGFVVRKYQAIAIHTNQQMIWDRSTAVLLETLPLEVLGEVCVWTDRLVHDEDWD